MGNLASGGGTSAVAASAHAACERHRRTDSLLTGVRREVLAAQLGAPDTSAGIPEARFMRAMTFERLVLEDGVAPELTTTTLGQAGLERPAKVARIDCRVDPTATAKALVDADMTATFGSTATMLTRLALPFPGLEGEPATSVLPDFAVVAPRVLDDRTVGSWLIMGDAKDYERVRAQIDDGRLLKGFLQVALGAEAAEVWSAKPAQMAVSDYGALAVPRNAFLRPEILVELITDHRAEVRARSEERVAAWRAAARSHQGSAVQYVTSLPARFDPGSCPTCSLMSFCREELRAANDRMSLLIELGVRPSQRTGVIAALEEPSAPTRISAEALIRLEATEEGRPVWRGTRRLDCATERGSIYLAVAKSDAAALGIYGMSIRRATAGRWDRQIFLDPQAPATRRAAMRMIGAAVRSLWAEGTRPIHLVVPDGATGDLLVTAADSVAGVELSRMRWQRDEDMGRTPVTPDGTPATIPTPLDADERLGAALLLEADRSRALSTRTPIVDLRAALAAQVVPGGPESNALRLDYLVEWCTSPQPCDHRAISDAIEQRPHTPGARLANEESDRIHAAYMSRSTDPDEYRRLVGESLAYKESTVDAALDLLAPVALSNAQPVMAGIERRAQAVWQRRVELGAFDLVRFSRTPEIWRDQQTATMESDAALATGLRMVVDPHVALDAGRDIGTSDVACATVVDINPVRISIDGRAFTTGDRVVALHHNGEALCEDDGVQFDLQTRQVKIEPLPLAVLSAVGDGVFAWDPDVSPSVAIGDSLVVARENKQGWFKKAYANGRAIALKSPTLDNSGPQASCSAAAFAAGPDAHRWCCRPHSVAEAETSDYFAQQRAQGLMNPDTWPPLVDDERFDVGGSPPPDEATVGAPAGLTRDDLD